jgi:thiamine-phosphate pyrophosphorylase
VGPAVEVTHGDEMSAPRLVVITDRESGPLDVWLRHLQELLAAAEPGAVQVLLRDPRLPIRERRQFGELLRKLTEQHRQSLSVGDRLDLAVLLRADAVHLSEASVTTEDARLFARLHGQSWAVSAAAHAPERCLTATEDALLLSPIMAPRKGRAPLGLAGVRQARLASRARSPELGSSRFYALGGVTSQNARALLDAGADGVALIGELFEPGAPTALVSALGIQR